jgi:ABC-type glycerol-3-phosphate transport system permease component
LAAGDALQALLVGQQFDQAALRVACVVARHDLGTRLAPILAHAGVNLPMVVAKFAQDHEIQHGPMAAASILATIPALVLMVFGQRFIVQGLTLGSVK